MAERPELDARLEAALRSVMAQDGPEDLARRVRARLQPRPPLALARGFRIGLAGAALAVVALSSVLLWSPGPRSAPVAPRRPATREPVTTAALSDPAEPAASAPIAGATLALPAPRSPARQPPLPGAIEPLPAPEPIALPALAEERLRIPPLSIDAVKVEPLVVERLADTIPEGGTKP